jgi:hypothetical protein
MLHTAAGVAPDVEALLRFATQGDRVCYTRRPGMLHTAAGVGPDATALLLTAKLPLWWRSCKISGWGFVVVL